MVIIDAHTKYPEAFLMKNITASETEKRMRETFSRFGLPEIVVSDNGPQLVPKELKNFFKMLR